MLSDAVLVRRNGGAQQVSCLIIQRADIAALEVISLSTPTAPTPIAPISQPTNSQHQVSSPRRLSCERREIHVVS